MQNLMFILQMYEQLNDNFQNILSIIKLIQIIRVILASHLLHNLIYFKRFHSTKKIHLLL